MTRDPSDSQTRAKSLRQRLNSLSPAQRATLARHLARPRDLPIPRRPPGPVDGDGSVVRPASFSQRRMWFLHHYSPTVPLYNTPRAFRMRGPLDTAVLLAAIDEVARRQDSLRTTLEMRDGEIAQRIRPGAGPPLQVLDLRHLPETQRDPEADLAIRATAAKPFDLTVGPLWRALLVRLRHDDHVLLVVFHHAISDGWSLTIFWKELCAIHRHLAADGPPLEQPTIQFSDFSEWQRHRLSDGPLEDDVRYWRHRLLGAPSHLDLPADRPRPRQESFRGETLRETLDASLRRRLATLSRENGATLFMSLLAAFGALLARLSGEDDIVIGTPIANRIRPETEALIGYFANTLPLRIDLSGDPPFRELLRRVKDMTLAAHAHQNTPFELLAERLDIPRDPSRAPIFQQMFVYRDFPEPHPTLPGLDIRPWPVETDTSKFDLSWHVDPSSDGLAIAAEYATDLFDRARIQRMIGHWIVFLEGIATDPAERISRLPLLSADEERRLLVEWNPAADDAPDEKCLHQPFLEQAARSPRSVAVDTGVSHLTYRELDAASGRLAHRLRAIGAGPDSRVAVLAERSPDLLIAILGILRSGAAYVPLDPDYPAARLDLMLSDSGAIALVAQPHLVGRTTQPPRHVVCLERADVTTPADAPTPGATPRHLAYVMYTSGSTGSPKGVMIEHASASAYALAAGGMFGLEPGDRFLQFASPCFDTSVEEIFATLASGATIVPRDPEMLASMASFLSRCRKLDITAMHLPTAFWHALVTAMGEHDLSLPERVRLIAIGGEKASPDTVAAWHRRSPAGVRLINSYGPTECTVSATWCDLTPGIGAPIGRPVPGSKAHVLDQHRNLVPVGLTGELFVGGACLARGYLGREDLTRERFIADPFDPSQAARLYRTGDLVRRRSDGMLDFVGRSDDQIKIRGFRVEPAEIEAAIATHPGVASCAVVSAPDPHGEFQIVAYVIPAGTTPPHPQDVRTFLKNLLPGYMVPAHVITLDAFPLNPNGKIDRSALPAPGPQTAPQMDSQPPQGDPIAGKLAAIWREILRVPRVGANDSFFELGGHSLLAMRLMARIAQCFGKSLPLAAVFNSPSLGEMAKTIAQSGSADAGQDAGPIRRLAIRSEATTQPQA